MENNTPNIFTLNNRCVLGTLGPKTFQVQQPVCSQCNRTLKEEIDYSEIDYRFDQYNGEDLFSANNALIVTTNLYDALVKNNIKGMIPVKVTTTQKDVPDFIHLAIIPSRVENIPITFDAQEKCNVCNSYILKFDLNKFKLNFRKDTENAIHLQVDHSTWNGNDLFDFKYHGEIGVTQKFLDVINDFNCPENVIIPAEWI